ncbi:unnamed protein product [Prorocentrum cordatum]|uniref:Uncharacterized protein n=1 Tax=Prorocentrum cordatum TaxID=2364126 RepID=A0ABN9XIJ8_9DINO|nr:unnamed protein product [Polarella glacialis]
MRFGCEHFQISTLSASRAFSALATEAAEQAWAAGSDEPFVLAALNSWRFCKIWFRRESLVGSLATLRQRACLATGCGGSGIQCPSSADAAERLAPLVVKEGGATSPTAAWPPPRRRPAGRAHG